MYLDGDVLKCRIHELVDNRYIASVETNIQLQELAVKALAISDAATRYVSATEFRKKLYSKSRKTASIIPEYNLFDMIGSLYNDPRLSVKTRGVLIRFFEFREH